MKLVLIGTGIMIFAAIAAMILKVLGFVTLVSLLIILAIVMIGSIIQMIGLFLLRPPTFNWPDRQ